MQGVVPWTGRAAPVLAGIVLLAVATAGLYLVDVTVSQYVGAYAELRLDSASAIEITVPEGAVSPVLELVATANNRSSSPMIIVVAGSNGEPLARVTVRPGAVKDEAVPLPGPGKYHLIILPGDVGCEGALRARLKYRVPALYTEASSLLGPVGVIAGFLAGWGLARSANTRDEARDNTPSTPTSMGGHAGDQGGEQA